MSSILDALERASQDRSSSDLELMPKAGYADSSHERRLWQWLLPGLGVVSLCLIGIWLYKTQFLITKDDALIADESAQQSQADPKSVPGSVIEPPAVPVSQNRPDLESQLIGRGVPSQRSLLDEAVLSQPKQKKLKVRKESDGILVKSTPETPSAPSVVKAIPAAKLKPKPQPKGVSSVAKNVRSDPVVTAAKKVTPLKSELDTPTPLVPPEPEVKVVEKIPLIWEMSQSLREKLEQLKISIHVYHEDPKRRFVLINMRRYSEGDSLKVDGYRLKRIDREGIVVDHGDGLVRLLRERY
ncbi:MAG: general secretion pathway protein GspB [Candidatus Thiodiazotropha sp. 6PDIVS]